MNLEIAGGGENRSERRGFSAIAALSLAWRLAMGYRIVRHMLADGAGGNGEARLKMSTGAGR